jgi:hypothetical protein
MVTDEDYERAASGRPIYPAQNPAQSDADVGRLEPTRQKQKTVIPARNEDHGPFSTPTGSPTQPAKAGVSVSAKVSRHKTRHNEAGQTADLAELACCPA